MSQQDSTESKQSSRSRVVGEAPGAFAYDEPIVTRPKWPAWLRIAVLPVLMLASTLSPVIFGVIPGYADFVRSFQPDSLQRNLFNAVPILLAPLTAILFVWLLVRFVDGMRLRDVGFTFDRRTLPTLVVGYVAMMVISLAVSLATQAAGWNRPPEGSFVDFWGGLLMVGLGMGLIYQGFPEEFYWRGYGMATLRDHPERAVWITGAIFGAMHIASAGGQENQFERIIYVVHAFAFAMLAGALALALRSMWAAVGVHAGLHLGNYLMGYAGIGSGPAQWAIESVVLVAVAVVIMRRWSAGRPTTAGVTA